MDDEPDARELIGRVLEAQGARVRSASTAEEALRMIEVSRPDVLLSDVGMLNTAFAAYAGSDYDYYPAERRSSIDEINAIVYPNVNNGVYRCGFARSQEAYERAARRLFDTLDALEERLARTRYLVGDALTEADWRLFTTLLRFDAVYYGHFKCNLRRLDDYPNLSDYLRELYHVPGVADTVSFDHIKRHYYMGSVREQRRFRQELHFTLPMCRERPPEWV